MLWNHLSFTIALGEKIAIVGRSGSGKSTLLHCLGLLEQPDKGDIILDNHPVRFLTEAKRCALRNACIGFVFQHHHLLMDFTALENVMMPLWIRDGYHSDFKEATSLLNRLGLGKRLHHRPAELSGGERQRVAIARAIISHPKLILADEPTGNLDAESESWVMEAFQSCVDKKSALILVTHDKALASQMQRIIEL